MARATTGCSGEGFCARGWQKGTRAALRDSLFGPQSAAARGGAAGCKGTRQTRWGRILKSQGLQELLRLLPPRCATRSWDLHGELAGGDPASPFAHPSFNPRAVARSYLRAFALAGPFGSTRSLGTSRTPVRTQFSCASLSSPPRSSLVFPIAALILWGSSVNPSLTVSCPLTVSTLCFLIHPAFRILRDSAAGSPVKNTFFFLPRF